MSCYHRPDDESDRDNDGDRGPGFRDSDSDSDYDPDEPVGSCEHCEINLYADDEYDGLCGQCYWLSTH